MEVQHQMRVAAQQQQDALSDLAGWLAQPQPVVARNSGNASTGTARDGGKAPSPESCREAGNAAYNAGRYSEAVDCYSRSIRLSPRGNDNSLAYSNRAMARLKLKEWRLAELDADAALRLDPLFCKSWQRRASARQGLGRVLEACMDLRVASALAGGEGSTALLRAVEEEARLCRARAPQLALHVELGPAAAAVGGVR